MYDLIGDLHGHAEPLRALLARLGYRCSRGVWRHPERRVIFVGDFIDRGPHQVETIAIARAMIDSGSALAVMGNHEFNAVAWTLPHPGRSGEWLRPHNARNRGHHQAFLDQVGEDSPRHREMVAWFRSLPLYLDLPGLRVVHACWHPGAVARLAPHLDAHGRVRGDAWTRVAASGTDAYAAAELLLKGIEVTLPSGLSFVDGEGSVRKRVRMRWWQRDGGSWRDLLMVPRSLREQLPEQAAPHRALPGYDAVKPVFLGHYWLSGEPAPLTPHIACLDYSVAARGARAAGKLCAYRWSGEQVLCPTRFHWVPAR